MLINLNSRRVSTVGKVLDHSKIYPNLSLFMRCKSDDVVVTIADVSKRVKPTKNPEYVPRKYISITPNQETSKHLKWMLQKDILNQDIFLMGGPGFKRRELALSFLELTDRELEFISLSRDTTEADLKQRREIKGGTAYYHDQGAVRAATNGRVLVIEGVEKAERNVLPILNNLLENREMHLEDGRFLMPALRYDKLLEQYGKKELDAWNLVRVSEDFRIIALGLPSPRYPGHPLDPPLRSRFQARHIPPLSFQGQLDTMKSLAPNACPQKLSKLLSCAYALASEESMALGLPDFPLDSLPLAAQIWNEYPDLSAFDIIYRFYPYELFLGKEGRNAVEYILGKFSAMGASKEKTVKLIKIPSKSSTNILDNSYVDTNYQSNLIANLSASQIASDVCLIGPKGCGKSTTVRRLADLQGYQVESVVLYQDMTSRDLIQQRTTLANGDTVWRNSPLVDAALQGKLAVLDGIHRIHSSTLSVLHRLIHDRELQLHDGTRLIRIDRYEDIKKDYNKSDDEMRQSGILPIHPAFKIVALAEPPVMESGSGQWLNSELLSMFLFHEMRPLHKSEEIHMIRSKFGEPSGPLLSIIELAHTLRSSSDPTLKSLAGSLSTRQLLRIAERMQKFETCDAYDAVQRACLSRFLPAIAKQALESCTQSLNMLPRNNAANMHIKCEVTGDTVKIGDTVVNRYSTTAMAKVPDILFYDMPQHLTLLESLIQDFTLGQNLLLVGNQGVGKNKIADRLLQLLNRPREYIQLHRDTTVQTLTLQPMVKDGRVIYEDSPLVQAVKSGHVLIVDEADKAPTHVTCILKSLVESGEMILSDGRRIVPANSIDAQSPNSIEVHPDFRMIVLANRPGFPFLGNDFFGALGDLFSTHSVDNPSIENEISLLKQYGPDVDEQIILKLVKTFGELRSMADQGLVSYPYSTREVVNIVKHLQKFPNEPLAVVVRNVFDFDRYSQEVFDTLVSVLHKHGIPIGTSAGNVALASEISLPKVKLCGTWSIKQNRQLLAVQERFIKLTPPKHTLQKTYNLDQIHARSAWFTELQMYWNLPIPETGTIAGLAASKITRNCPVRQTVSTNAIHVLAVNPLCMFTVTPEFNDVKRTTLHGLIDPQRGTNHSYNIACDKNGNVLVHEDANSSVLVVNVDKGTAQGLRFSSFLEAVTDTITSAIRNECYRWKMKAELLLPNNQIVFYTSLADKIEVIDFNKMCAYSLTLPCEIESIAIPSEKRWLVQDTSGNTFILEKSSDTVPCPDTMREVEVINKGMRTSSILSSSQTGLSADILSKALQQNIDSPNRLLVTDNTYAGIAVGFPDLDSTNEFYVWPRKQRSTSYVTPIVTESGSVVRTVPSKYVPDEIVNDKEKQQPDVTGYIEIVDTVNRKARYIPVPEPSKLSQFTQWIYSRDYPVFATPLSDDTLVTVDVGGCVRIWETSVASLSQSLEQWRRAVGNDGGNIQITKERYSGEDVSGPKHGKVDENNDPHVGGNTWAGGTGGRDTAGLGGKGGPYRLDAGHNVHQLSDEEKNAVPDHVKKAAREMGQEAFKQKLRDIRMSEYDHNVYSQYSDPVQKQVQALRVILGSLQAKSNERQWCRHQTSGELDDTKLIEGLTGERTIYRRRTEKEPEVGAPLLRPKRLKLVVDVSGSMYRFNGYDGRLDREMEACVMMMEAFSGYESKFQYDIVGHSGEDFNITFVDRTNPPSDNKQRLKVIKTMHAHSQFCMSGDHTLEATEHAINKLAKEESDESIVVVLSDANLERYGISPARFARVLTSNTDVNAFAIFIGSLGDQAERLLQKMPSSRAFVCMDLKDIPRILQQIFSSSVLSTIRSS